MDEIDSGDESGAEHEPGEWREIPSDVALSCA
jgi:hypothetical protein